MEIKLLKGKLFLFFIGSFAFFLLGIYTILYPDEMSTFLNRPILARLIGILTFLMCGILMVVLLKVYFNKKGLIINEEGIMDYSSMLSGYLITWNEIVAIRKVNIRSLTILLIDIEKPNEYINQFGRLKSWWLRLSANSYGTPISLSSYFLDCKTDELEIYIRDAYQKYKSKEI